MYFQLYGNETVHKSASKYPNLNQLYSVHTLSISLKYILILYFVLSLCLPSFLSLHIFGLKFFMQTYLFLSLFRLLNTFGTGCWFKPWWEQVNHCHYACCMSWPFHYPSFFHCNFQKSKRCKMLNGIFNIRSNCVRTSFFIRRVEDSMFVKLVQFFSLALVGGKQGGDLNHYHNQNKSPLLSQ